MNDTFTIADAIAIQAQDLARWKTVLKPEIFDALIKVCEERNAKGDNPFTVMRGDYLSEWVLRRSYADSRRT